MKVRSSAISIVLVLIMILGSLGITNVNENNIENYIAKDSVAVADFIEDNFDKFVNEYNMATSQKWQASFVENRYDMLINENGDKYSGVFLDFDGANGYAVVGNNYTMLDFTTEGESPYLNINFDNCLYSTVTGYLYEVNGECLSVNEDFNAGEEVFDYSLSNSKHYDGQKGNAVGCGRIENTDLYMKSRYGSGWKKAVDKSLSMTGYEQGKLSIYKQNKIVDGKVVDYSEGNCWVVSAFNALQYLADKNGKFNKLPKSTKKSTYNPKIFEPNIYSIYFDEYGNNKSRILYGKNKSAYEYELWYPMGTEFPDLYIEMRKIVNQKYGQINDGGSVFKTADIIENVCGKYGINVTANTLLHLFSIGDQNKSQIDKGYPFLWSTYNNTYGMHTMAVCGYKVYSKTSGWWIFKVTQYKLFYELKDGWDSKSMYYNVSGHTSGAMTITIN